MGYAFTSLGLMKLLSFTIHIHSEREMCGQCAAASREMMAHLTTHAPKTA